MLEPSRFSGLASRTNPAKRRAHSLRDRHSSGLPAMTLPMHRVKPHWARHWLMYCASGSRRARIASASAPSTASKRMPLSWSVCRVCSRRPSLPKHSQLNGTPGSPRSARASSMTRHTVWSLSKVMIWVICVDDAPWASMRSTSWLISPRSETSVSRRGAWRMVRAR
ncbi:hypothetical protein D3C78_1409860 [compost metagenome]